MVFDTPEEYKLFELILECYCYTGLKFVVDCIHYMLPDLLSDILLITFDLTCFSCMEGTLIFKVSRFGAGYFIGCDQHPRCK